MLRPISRLHSIQKTLWLARSARHCSGNVNNKISGLDRDELSKRINLREQLGISLDQQSGSQIDFQSFTNSNFNSSETTPQRKQFESSSDHQQSVKSVQQPFPEDDQPLSVGREYFVPENDCEPSGEEKSFWIQKRATNDTFEGTEPIGKKRIRLNRPENLRIEMVQLKGNIQSCTDVVDLFDLIKPHMNRLNGTQIGATCDKLNNLYYEARKEKGEMAKFQKIVSTSPVFRSFLNRVNYSMINLEPTCLVSILHMFSLLHQDPSTQIVRNTVQLLQTKQKELTLNDLTRCLFVLHSYMEQIPTRSQTLHAFNQELILVAKDKILKGEYDAQDINTVSRYYFIFLKFENDRNQEVVKRLTESLLNPEINLSLYDAVKLLRRIKQSHVEFRAKKLKDSVSKEADFRQKSNKLYPKILGELIDKCNTTIYETLYVNQSDEDLHFYFANIHDCVDTLNFELPNFYDPKLLNFLVPYLLRVADQKPYYKYFIYYLTQNYDKNQVYDEALLHYVYELYCSDEHFKSKVDFSQFYNFISKYQLPFINHQRIAAVSLENTYFLHSSIRFANNSLKVLVKYLLNDGNDETFLLFLSSKISCIEQRFYRTVSYREYKEFSLAKSYLSLSNAFINESLKTKLEYALEIAMRNLLECNRKPPITEMYFEFDNRLQRTGFLTDGLYLDGFGIYDKSTNSLVSLTQHTQYFDSLENIPLSESQEM